MRLQIPRHGNASLCSVAAHHVFDGILPQPCVSPVAFSAAVAASGRAALPAFHGLAVVSGLDAFAFVSNSLSARYAKTGSFPSAERVFQTARTRDVSSYNTILSAAPDPDEALAFASWMLRTGDVRPDAVTLTVALTLAAGRKEDGLVRQLHALASRSGLAADVFVGNALVTAYSRGGFLGAARNVFEGMPARDLVSWNAMICGLAQDGDCPAEVIRVFLAMLKDGAARPDRISVCSVIPSCGGEGKLELGRQIHGLAVKLGVEGHVSVGNVLVAMYYKCGTSGCARKLLESMHERDVISWTTALSMDGEEDATALFNAMRRDGVSPNEVTFVAMMSALPEGCPAREGQMIHTACLKTGISDETAAANSLITMYAKLRHMDDARTVFDLMPRREIIAWNALISGYAQNEQCSDALEVFSSMVRWCLKPNETTFASVLSAVVTAVETVSMAYGQMCHCQTLKLGLNASEYVSGALIDMYAKRGSLEESRKVFDGTAHRSLIVWTAMISANAKHGGYDDVMSLFDDMVRSGIAPDGVLLLAVLTACRYRGAVDTGLEIFDSMAAEHCIELWPEHYACVIDMLGRAGRLEEAEELMLRMPSGPSISALQSLMGACRIHGNAAIAERVAGILTETEPTESGTYVLLSNIYADKGDWGGVAEVRRQMRDRGVRKEIGFSWVDADASAGAPMQLHKFSSDDATHPLTEEIYSVAEGLGWEMKFLKSSLHMEMLMEMEIII